MTVWLFVAGGVALIVCVVVAVALLARSLLHSYREPPAFMEGGSSHLRGDHAPRRRR